MNHDVPCIILSGLHPVLKESPSLSPLTKSMNITGKIQSFYMGHNEPLGERSDKRKSEDRTGRGIDSDELDLDALDDDEDDDDDDDYDDSDDDGFGNQHGVVGGRGKNAKVNQRKNGLLRAGKSQSGKISDTDIRGRMNNERVDALQEGKIIRNAESIKKLVGKTTGRSALLSDSIFNVFVTHSTSFSYKHFYFLQLT